MASDLALRAIFCNFLIASALVALARAEDNVEQQLQDYLVLRKHVVVADVDIQLRLQDRNMDEVSAQDLVDKLAQLLAFDFEAAVALKKYSELRDTVVKASQCQNLETFKAMADCALRSCLPVEGNPSHDVVSIRKMLIWRPHAIELFVILRAIINQITELDEWDPTKLAKYTRCLYQATLPFRKQLGGKLLHETCRMVQDAHQVSHLCPKENIEEKKTM